MRRFFAPPQNFSSQKVLLNADETRHLRDVLRLRVGDNVIVFDGCGKEFSCQIEIIGKKDAQLKITQQISPTSPESNLHLTLAVAMLKGEKFDLVIQKAVELGVSKFVPIITRRTDVKLNEKGKKIERWQRIILESSKQCGRANLMKIVHPIEFRDFILTSPANPVLFSERDGKGFKELKESSEITAIIGSEGGWEVSEIEFARESKVEIVTLGGRILRAETAAIAIPALLQNHWGDLS